MDRRCGEIPTNCSPSPTDAAEATYNAALAQLDPSLPLLEYGLPFADDDSDRLAPGIWISAVGGTSLVPLAALRVPAPEGTVSAPRLLRQPVGQFKQREKEEVPLGAPMPLVMVLWGALSAAIVRVCSGRVADLTTVVVVESEGIKMKSSAPTTEAKEEWFIEDLYQEVERISLDLHRRLYTWLQVVALVALYVPFAATIYHAYSGRGASVFI